MHLSTAILGKAIVDTLEARQSTPVLVIGSDTFTRPQLSKIGCFNFMAAARLSYLLTHELKVKSARDLFQNYGPQHLALPGLDIPTPTSLYAAPEDWASPDLSARIARAATELTLLLRSGVTRDISEDNWSGYQHQFAGNATRAERSVTDVDFDTDLMRLAAGGGQA